MSDPAPLLVAGLCAAWCGSCRDWRPVFEREAEQFEALARFVWVDIEDHAEAVGDELELETFPSLLIADGDDTVRFFGALTPHPQALAQLVRRAVGGGLGVVADPRLAGLPERLRSLGAAA